MIQNKLITKLIVSFLTLIIALGSIKLYDIDVFAVGDDSRRGNYPWEWLANGPGYWNGGSQGLRFSLVDNSGKTKKVVDVFDLSHDERTGRTVHGIPCRTDGTIGNILSGDSISEPRYRAFNKCKIEIAKEGSTYDLDSNCIDTGIPLAETYDKYISYRGSDWFCTDFRFVFKHWDWSLDYDDSHNLKNSDNHLKFVDLFCDQNPNDEDNPYAKAKQNAIDEFISKRLTGVVRKNVEPFQPSNNTWLGMCDLLYAMELPIDKDGLNWETFDPNDPESKTTLYNNLIDEFVLPEYCVIVEPITFWGIGLIKKVPIDEEDGGDYKYVFERTAIYYGSMTELGIAEANEWIYRDDKCDDNGNKYLSAINKNGKDRCFKILHNCVITRCLGLQCAWIPNEYEFEIKKYAGIDLYGNPCLQIVNNNDFNAWRDLYGNNYDEYGQKYDLNIPHLFTAYPSNIIQHYAIGMSIITSSDFIKPQVETYDSEYRTDTNVVTSLKVSNRSDTDYTTLLSATPNTVVNKNGVPKAMLCKFTVSKITDESGEVGRWTADRSDITNQFKQKVEELEFAKDDDGEYITEFYGSLDGLKPREETNANAPCYVSFNWKTPKKPCKVTFEVEFLNANSNPEPVLGTDEHDGLRATEMDEDMRNIYGKYITYFDCDIAEGENTTYFTEATVPPDSVSIISVAPNAAEGTEEQKLYKLNHDIYDAYQVAHGTTPAVYTGTDFAGKTIVDSQSWSEYVASYDASNNIVLTHKPHNVSIGLSKTTDDTYTDSTTKILRTDQSGLYSDYADTIGSGYGIGVDFISSYSNDEAGVDYIRDVTVNGVTYQNSLVTNYDHGVVMFPEYSFQTYYGEILQFDTDVDLVGRSAERRFMLPANKDSKFYDDSIERPAGMNDEEYAEYVEQNNSEKSRVHFTPVWYPDGTYQIVLCMFDAWTPAGQLWFYKTYNIEIKGSIYDTWYVTRTYKNQVAS